MDKLIINPTATSEWTTLVNEACKACSIDLTEDIESYLVFLLMRFTETPEIAKSILALEYLCSIQQLGVQRQHSLQDVGDKCLLFSGLFPGRARHRRVRISYFVNLGQSAYLNLSEESKQSLSPLFFSLSEKFVALMDILQTMREVHSEQLSLDAIQAEEIWQDTGSKHALHTLKKFSQYDFFINPNPNSSSKH